MKQVIKISMAVFAISAVTFFAACNNSKGDTKTTTTDSTQTEAAHDGGDHIYTAPCIPK